MVVFTCGQCNESLKKNQVEKHYQSRCRNCNVLACVDCGKDFFGDSYKEHIKCISEEEKYSGKNYKPKPSANKGEVKQELWLQKVQMAIDKCVANPKMKNVLERMKDYPNIPRKKAKFENFICNSMNLRDKKLVSDVWELLLANTEQPNSEEINMKEVAIKNGHKSDENSNGNIPNKDELKQMSKQERKAERKRLKNKESTKLENDESVTKEEETIDKKKKTDSADEDSDKKKVKKRKQKSDEEDLDTTTKKRHIDDSLEDEDKDEETEINSSRLKFDWEGTITAVLSKKGEIAVKKLKKKVLAQYQAEGGKAKSEEKIFAKLNRKINKNPKFIVKKDKVKLKS